MGTPVSLNWLGIGREQIAGTPVLPTATVPVLASDYDPEDVQTFLADDGVRSAMASPSGMVAGRRSATHSYSGPFYLDSGGFWLDNLFGDLSTVANASSSGAAVALANPVNIGDTVLTVGTSLGSVVTGSVIQIGDGAASEVVTATAGSSGTTVHFAGQPCRFPHATTATASLQGSILNYQHVFAVLNNGTGQPPVHTITDTTGLTASVKARCYPSVALASLTLSASPAGFLTVKVGGTSWLSIPAASTPVAGTSFTSALPGWTATISVAGGQYFSVGPWEVNFTRQMVIYRGGQSSQTPAYLMRGDLKADGTFGYVLPTDETPLSNMLTAGPQQIVIAAGNGVSGSGALSVAVQMTSAQATVAKPVRNAVNVRYNANFGAIANITDVGGSGGIGVATVTVVNGTATY